LATEAIAAFFFSIRTKKSKRREDAAHSKARCAGEMQAGSVRLRQSEMRKRRVLLRPKVDSRGDLAEDVHTPLNELLKALVVSGSLGALIGLERQWDEQLRNPDGRIPAGVRTFTFLALIGTLCAHFSQHFHPAVYAAGLVAVAIWMGAYVVSLKEEKPGGGLTTASSAVMVYLIGGMAWSREWKEAVMLTVVVLILLSSKAAIHGLSLNFTKADVRMALQFLAVSGVVLPLVPDRAFGPYEAFNPHSVWLMVVLVSGLGFAGYVAVRALGQSLGILLTGLAGGLASSTATTLSMSRMSRERPDFSSDCSLAILLACTVMLWRVNVMVLFVSPALAVDLLPDMIAMSLPGIAVTLWHFRHPGARRQSSENYRNPLSLKVALQFAALYAVVVFVVKAANANFGGAGLLVASLLSGLTDLDAISLSISNLFSGNGVSLRFAGACIVLAAVANSFTKLTLAWFLGDRQLRKKIFLLLGTTILIGLGFFAFRLLV
jgi:uncharacterized membrane protein (DUF4010 family)